MNKEDVHKETKTEKMKVQKKVVEYVKTVRSVYGSHRNEIFFYGQMFW